MTVLSLSPFTVFLGGSCNPTTWRKDIAIPLLEDMKVPYYNPQVDDWSPELVEIEATAKKDASVLLFVIDGQTRALASMLEALSQAGLGRDVIVCVEDIADGTLIEGQVITGRELKDLNRARSYFKDEISKHKTATIRPDVGMAVGAAIYQINMLCK